MLNMANLKALTIGPFGKTKNQWPHRPSRMTIGFDIENIFFCSIGIKSIFTSLKVLTYVSLEYFHF